MATRILTETNDSLAVQSTSDNAVSVDLEAQTPEEEYEAELGEKAMMDAYFADRGV